MSKEESGKISARFFTVTQSNIKKHWRVGVSRVSYSPSPVYFLRKLGMCGRKEASEGAAAADGEVVTAGVRAELREEVKCGFWICVKGRTSWIGRCWESRVQAVD